MGEQEQKLLTAEEVFKNTADEQTALAKQYEKSPDSVRQWQRLSDRINALCRLASERAIELEHFPMLQGNALMLGGMIKAAVNWNGNPEAHIHLVMDMLERLYMLEMEAIENRASDRATEVWKKHRDERQSKEAEIQSKDSKIKELGEEKGALEILLRDYLNTKHPKRPMLTQAEAADACGVSVETIRRWEKGKGKKGAPEWYPGRNVTRVEMETRARQAKQQKRMAQVTRRGIKNASQYIEGRDRDADDDK